MGLATVYGIIQQHRGWIEVDSKPERGSVFSLFLPVLENPSLLPPLEKNEHRSKHILIVEDDPSIRRVTALILQQRGFVVTEAATGREGLALWQRHGAEIHLVLADLVLPDGLLGLDLVEEVRRTRPRLPCILMSGFDTDAEQQLDLPRDCAYLHKPFDTHTLIREVHKALAPATP
jgi:CheY-like chemotaxis protein